MPIWIRLGRSIAVQVRLGEGIGEDVGPGRFGERPGLARLQDIVVIAHRSSTTVPAVTAVLQIETDYAAENGIGELQVTDGVAALVVQSKTNR